MMQYEEMIFSTEVKNYNANVLFNLIVGTNNIKLCDVLDAESFEEIMYKFNVTKEKSKKMMMAIELIKKSNKLTQEYPIEITNPRDVYDLMVSELRYEAKEHFYIICLNNRNKLIGHPIELTKGTNKAVYISQATFYKAAIVNNACSVIAVHNHPSGDPHPSKDDKDMTHLLVEAGSVIEIKLKDHVIIGNGEYYSFADEGLLK